MRDLAAKTKAAEEKLRLHDDKVQLAAQELEKQEKALAGLRARGEAESAEVGSLRNISCFLLLNFLIPFFRAPKWNHCSLDRLVC